MNGFGWAVGLGVVSRTFTIGARFLSVPLTVSLLSPEKYGLWMIASSLVGWLALSDLGIPAALQNQLIKVLREGNKVRTRELVGFTLRLLGGIGLCIAFLGIALAFFVPWERVFKISPGLHGEFVGTLCLCALGFALGLPTRIGVVLYNANGRLQVAPAAEIAAQSASLLLLLLAVHLQWNSLFALVACSLAGVALGPLAATITACRRYGYSTRWGGGAELQDRHAIVGKGFFFTIAALGELLILQSDAIIVGSFLGPAAVPAYIIPATLFLNFLQAQNIYLRPLWPVIASVLAIDDRVVLRRHFRRGLLICLGGAVVFAIGLIIAGDWFVRLWSKGLVSLPLSMAAGFGAYAIVASLDGFCATVLNAAGKIEFRCGYTVFLGIVKVAAAIWCVTTYGVNWLPLVFAIVMLFTSLSFACPATFRLVRMDDAAKPL